MRNLEISPQVWKVIALVWFIVGISAAMYRAFVDRLPTDTTTLGFLVFAFAAFVIPIVSSIALPGGAKIEFSKEVSENVSAVNQNYTLAIADIAQLLRDIIATQTNLSTLFRGKAIDQPTAYALALEVTVSMMVSCKRWLVPQQLNTSGTEKEELEEVRVTLWRWDDEQRGLTFVAGTVSELQGEVLSLVRLSVDDDDYMGRAWRGVRISNEPRAINNWRAPFQPSPDDLVPYPDPVPFQGLMFVPVLVQGRPYALLEIDRQKALRFDINAQVVASALAEFISGVFSDPLVNWGLLLQQTA